MASRSKYTSVNLNSSYGKTPTPAASQPYRPAAPRSGGSFGTMQVLGKGGRPGSAPAAAKPKLTVPIPVNLPSLKREHGGNDPAVSLVLSGSTAGWIKPDKTAASDASDKTVGAVSGAASGRHGDESVLETGVDNKVFAFGSDGPTKPGVYKPPAARGGSAPVLPSVPQKHVRSTGLLKGEDFPSLQAAVSPPPPPPATLRAAKDVSSRKKHQEQGTVAGPAGEKGPDHTADKKTSADISRLEHVESASDLEESKGADASGVKLTWADDVEESEKSGELKIESQAGFRSDDKDRVQLAPQRRSPGDSWRSGSRSPPLSMPSQQREVVRDWEDDERNHAAMGPRQGPFPARSGQWQRDGRGMHGRDFPVHGGVPPMRHDMPMIYDMPIRKDMPVMHDMPPMRRDMPLHDMPGRGDMPMKRDMPMRPGHLPWHGPPQHPVREGLDQPPLHPPHHHPRFRDGPMAPIPPHPHAAAPFPHRPPPPFAGPPFPPPPGGRGYPPIPHDRIMRSWDAGREVGRDNGRGPGRGHGRGHGRDHAAFGEHGRGYERDRAFFDRSKPRPPMMARVEEGELQRRGAVPLPGLEFQSLPRVGIDPPPRVGLESRAARMRKAEDVASFRDVEREKFEAELEAVQKLKELERQRKVEEEQRVLEQARLEAEERERRAREEEEEKARKEQEAIEAAEKEQRETEERARWIEEEKRAAQEEKRRWLEEEERRKENAKKKLQELEERIARRKQEEEEKGRQGGAAVTSLSAKQRDEEDDEWDDSERNVLERRFDERLPTGGTALGRGTGVSVLEAGAGAGAGVRGGVSAESSLEVGFDGAPDGRAKFEWSTVSPGWGTDSWRRGQEHLPTFPGGRQQGGGRGGGSVAGRGGATSGPGISSGDVGGRGKVDGLREAGESFQVPNGDGTGGDVKGKDQERRRGGDSGRMVEQPFNGRGERVMAVRQRGEGRDDERRGNSRRVPEGREEARGVAAKEEGRAWGSRGLASEAATWRRPVTDMAAASASAAGGGAGAGAGPNAEASSNAVFGEPKREEERAQDMLAVDIVREGKAAVSSGKNGEQASQETAEKRGASVAEAEEDVSKVNVGGRLKEASPVESVPEEESKAQEPADHLPEKSGWHGDKQGVMNGMHFGRENGIDDGLADAIEGSVSLEEQEEQVFDDEVESRSKDLQVFSTPSASAGQPSAEVRSEAGVRESEAADKRNGEQDGFSEASAAASSQFAPYTMFPGLPLEPAAVTIQIGTVPLSFPPTFGLLPGQQQPPPQQLHETQDMPLLQFGQLIPSYAFPQLLPSGTPANSQPTASLSATPSPLAPSHHPSAAVNSSAEAAWGSSFSREMDHNMHNMFGVPSAHQQPQLWGPPPSGQQVFSHPSPAGQQQRQQQQQEGEALHAAGSNQVSSTGNTAAAAANDALSKSRAQRPGRGGERGRGGEQIGDGVRGRGRRGASKTRETAGSAGNGVAEVGGKQGNGDAVKEEQLQQQSQQHQQQEGASGKQHRHQSASRVASSVWSGNRGPRQVGPNSAASAGGGSTGASGIAEVHMVGAADDDERAEAEAEAAASSVVAAAMESEDFSDESNEAITDKAPGPPTRGQSQQQAKQQQQQQQQQPTMLNMATLPVDLSVDETSSAEGGTSEIMEHEKQQLTTDKSSAVSGPSHQTVAGFNDMLAQSKDMSSFLPSSTQQGFQQSSERQQEQQRQQQQQLLHHQQALYQQQQQQHYHNHQQQQQQRMFDSHSAAVSMGMLGPGPSRTAMVSAHGHAFSDNTWATSALHFYGRPPQQQGMSHPASVFAQSHSPFAANMPPSSALPSQQGMHEAAAAAAAAAASQRHPLQPSRAPPLLMLPGHPFGGGQFGQLGFSYHLPHYMTPGKTPDWNMGSEGGLGISGGGSGAGFRHSTSAVGQQQHHQQQQQQQPLRAPSDSHWGPTSQPVGLHQTQPNLSATGIDLNSSAFAASGRSPPEAVSSAGPGQLMQSNAQSSSVNFPDDLGVGDTSAQLTTAVVGQHGYGELPLRHVDSDPSASPAVGSSVHGQEQRQEGSGDGVFAPHKHASMDAGGYGGNRRRGKQPPRLARNDGEGGGPSQSSRTNSQVEQGGRWGGGYATTSSGPSQRGGTQQRGRLGNIGGKNNSSHSSTSKGTGPRVRHEHVAKSRPNSTADGDTLQSDASI